MKYILLLLVCCLSHLLLAQAEPGMETGIFRLERGTFNSHQVMIGRKLPSSQVKGDYYLDSKWHEGSFMMKDGRSSAKYQLRYDVENELLEIQWGKMIKVAGEEYLASFRWSDDVGEKFFLNAGQFTYHDTPLSGFVELLYQGDDSLLLKTDTFLKKADYVEGLDMGSRQPEIIKKQTFLVVHGGEAFEISRRKDFLRYADQVSPKVLKYYIRQERINFKVPTDLGKLINHYEKLKNR